MIGSNNKMTEQSYRDQFKEASEKRHKKQKKFVFMALAAIIGFIVLVIIAIVLVFGFVSIGDVKLSPTSSVPMLLAGC
jgi:cytoskeletal protein RodZ